MLATPSGASSSTASGRDAPSRRGGAGASRAARPWGRSSCCLVEATTLRRLVHGFIARGSWGFVNLRDLGKFLARVYARATRRLAPGFGPSGLVRTRAGSRGTWDSRHVHGLQPARHRPVRGRPASFIPGPDSSRRGSRRSRALKCPVRSRLAPPGPERRGMPRSAIRGDAGRQNEAFLCEWITARVPCRRTGSSEVGCTR